ncbi:SRPBCC family protein [Mycobacterium sp. E740]|uniref:SRPBCC family protein n=1 Tax=Mycobacterium sp. E740 TaxID=1834149 RepID=UPI0007FF2974|nr:SRPBCC family protein [Mycobacterium sp. E740]OBI82334.1 polyketide cyclase [Mycobacterium sp. E740]
MNITLREGMPTVQRVIPAPADAVWNVLTDIEVWPKWGPTVLGAELSEAGPLRLGARGKVWTPLLVPIAFEITEFDDGRRWAWQVLGVNATRHGVDPRDDGCLAWMSAPRWATAYLPVCAIALQRIARMVG